MSDKKIIAVLGATGAQGGGLVRAILADPQGPFSVRAITRNADSDKAKALAALGAEVVEAEASDQASLEAAFAGAHGAYCVTFFWEDFSPERENADVRNMAQAAKAAGLKHVVWSTLEDTRKWVPLDDDRMPTLAERYKVPHFDAKGESDVYWDEAGVPTTFLLTTYYWDNLIHFGAHPQRGEDGSLVFTLPMGDEKLPGIAAEDIGKAAYGIFEKGQETVGQRIGIAGEHVSGAEMAAALSGVMGEPVHHFSPPFDMYRGFGFPGAEDLGNMFQFYHDFIDFFQDSRSVDVARALAPSVMDFGQWLAKYGDQIPRDPA